MRNTSQGGRTSEQTGNHDMWRTPAIGRSTGKFSSWWNPSWAPFPSTYLPRERTHSSQYTAVGVRPDPAALAVDALSIVWTKHHAYMFPPFTLITRCLEKILLDRASAVLIAPVWHSQLWYPTLLKSLMDYPILLPSTQEILLGPEGQSHPLVLQGHLP